MICENTMETMPGNGGNVAENRRIADNLWRAYTAACQDDIACHEPSTPDDDSSGKAEQLRQRTIALRNELVEHYLPLVKHQAQRLGSKLPPEVDIEDLMSHGLFGLMDAITRFDVGRGILFETFAPRRIGGAMLDYLRSMDWVPRISRTRAKQLNQAILSYQMEFGRPPTQDELAALLGAPKRELDRIISDGSVVGVTSLDRKINWNDSTDDSLFHLIKDRRATNPLSAVQRQDLKEIVTRNLSRSEQLIVVLYYHENMTMKEIGLTLDLSESRVSQMHSSILARLKAQLQSHENELVTMIG
jgi:RNA polymerase sigma factor for flagellar operon FliA